jgi:glycosyltransferase A (GT-A) superfamily protein (DUF2064 family)
MTSSPRTAVLIFADAQQRDLRRRGLSSRHASLVSLPRLQELSDRADLHWFTDAAARSNPVAQRQDVLLHKQRGNSFGERLENAVDDLAREGYDRIVIVGRDCPQLSVGDVTTAIEQLDTKQLILGPDHRGGCYLIAFHTADRARLRGILWQQNTDAAELLGRFDDRNVALLETKFDLDGIEDVRALARIWSLPIEYSRFAITPIVNLVRFLSHLRRFVQLPPPAAFV